MQQILSEEQTVQAKFWQNVTQTGACKVQL